ncbi:hypothetical protein B0T14DRAFT_595861 [Immersiella caudata]|uniref:Nephrocystin 3-like N-terminal domain-containing protein n=1 Tax=Immersiella caudata TaxID=314043 RepID=A0AA39U6P5_9PEZI|nr:hypothetical protein B0T14DRAFT_595861 [Immersiella caudata]
MVQLLVECLKYMTKTKFGKATDALVGETAEEIKSAQERLKDAITIYNTATHTMKTLIHTRDENVSRYQKAVNDLRNRDRLNPAAVHRDIVGRRVAGTGKWVTDSDMFKDWLASTPKHHSLWCLGEPGAGKSFLCLATFRHHLDRTTGKHFGLGREKLMGDILLDELEKTQTTCLDLLKAVVDVLRKYGLTCFVIIDALDEFQESSEPGLSRSELIEGLWKLPVKLLVTGRDIPSIRSECRNYRLQPVPKSDQVSGGLTWSEVKLAPDVGDLETYIKWRMAKGGTFQALKGESPGLLENIRSVLVEPNAGAERHARSFNLLRFRMNRIEELRTPGDIAKYLTDSELPVTDAEVYRGTFERIRNSVHRNNARRVIGWIYSAKRPLLIDELRYALISPDADALNGESMVNLRNFLHRQDDIQNWCQGIVIILKDSKHVAFAHPTVKDYLDNLKALTVLFAAAV